MVGIGVKSKLACSDWSVLSWVVGTGREKATHPPSVAATEVTVSSNLTDGTLLDGRFMVPLEIIEIPFVFTGWLVIIIFVVAIIVTYQSCSLDIIGAVIQNCTVTGINVHHSQVKFHFVSFNPLIVDKFRHA
jgi:hypothetical protein